jgi:hypothetical protein
MKKVFYLIVVLLVLTNSACKKDKVQLPDNILFQQFNPELQITSVDSMVLHPSGCGYIPVPSDSLASLSLDLNNDGTADHTVNCSSWYQFVSASGPCANYNQSITLIGTSEDNLIAVTSFYNIAEEQYEGNEIGGNQIYYKNSTIMLNSAQAPFSYNFVGDRYLGVQMKIQGKSHFGWIRINKTGSLIRIISCAMNLTPNHSILVGQTE